MSENLISLNDIYLSNSKNLFLRKLEGFPGVIGSSQGQMGIRGYYRGKKSRGVESFSIKNLRPKSFQEDIDEE